MDEQNFIFDNDLHNALENILQNSDLFSDYVVDIISLMYEKQLNRRTLSELMKQYNIKDIKEIKYELLDLLIEYIKNILKDGVITENEQRNIKMLKRYFRIKQGYFYKKRYYQIMEILKEQFEKLYILNKITTEEALYCVFLQDLFDLSFDQIDELKKEAAMTSLLLGADITDLDTSNSKYEL
jgi:hypothetical protein